MSRYQKVKLKQYAPIQDRESSEAKYWKTFAVTKEDMFYGTPNCISFNPQNPSTYAVTGSTKISLFDSSNDKVIKSFTRFTDEAFSGKFRHDGKLLLAGDKAGYLKVFDVATKAVLRQLRKHSSAVRTTSWTCDGLHMLTGSDDRTVKRWDIGTQDVVWSSTDAGVEENKHSDYVRCVNASPTSSDVFISGSYDHTVKMWDRRQPKCVFTFAHDSPVQHCDITSSGTMMISAAGNELCVWDLLQLSTNSGSGKKLPMHKFSSHQKDISSFCFDRYCSNRLLSCGLDGHIKIYNMATMQVAHGLQYPDPLVSIAIAQDHRKMVIGHANGTLTARNRRDDSAAPASMHQGSFLRAADSSRTELEGDSPAAAQIVATQATHYQGAGTIIETSNPSAGARGRREDGGGGSSAVLLETERSVRLRPYDVQLRKFQYQQALDSALRTRNPVVVITVLEELCRRSGLTIALSGREEEAALEPLLSFIVRYVSHPRYSRIIVQVAHRVLDLYQSSSSGSDAIDELFFKMHKQVKMELHFHKQIMRVKGSLDAVVNASASALSSK